MATNLIFLTFFRHIFIHIFIHIAKHQAACKQTRYPCYFQHSIIW